MFFFVWLVGWLVFRDRVLLCRLGWSAVVGSWLTAASASWIQGILLPQTPKQLGLQAWATTPSPSVVSTTLFFRDRCCCLSDMNIIKSMCNPKVQIWRWEFDLWMWSTFVECITVWNSVNELEAFVEQGPSFLIYQRLLVSHKHFFSYLYMAAVCSLGISQELMCMYNLGKL